MFFVRIKTQLPMPDVYTFIYYINNKALCTVFVDKSTVQSHIRYRRIGERVTV